LIYSRTTSLHHLYRNILGGDYIAPLKRPKMILDIEPRGGEWMQVSTIHDSSLSTILIIL
jgi:hypothetical protein